MQPRFYIPIGVVGVVVLVALIVGIASWQQEQEHIQARLQLARLHISSASGATAQALAPDFTISQAQTITAGCKEASPDFSFTRLYDCNATAKIQVSNAQGLPPARVEALLRAALARVGIAPTKLADLDGYVHDLDGFGAWKTAQPIDIPHTAIAGVPPFNYYGGIGQEDIGLQLAAEVDRIDPKKTLLSITAIQEYHSCKSFFWPCI